jgi:hypothetical protein
MDVLGKTQTNWTGTWFGVLKTYPTSLGGPEVNVTMEIGPYPMVDHSCTVWRNTYVEHGVVQQIKDYRFCRGNGADDLYTDEGNNVTIAARWIDNVLVAPFKYKGFFLVVYDRMVGDVLEEEILTVEDQPAADNVVSMRPLTIHLIKLKRIFF